MLEGHIPPQRFLMAVAACALVGSTILGHPFVPTTAQVRQASGHCLSAERAMKAGNLVKAREALERALHVIPTFPAAHMGMGHIALVEKRYEEALREYDTARRAYRDIATQLLGMKARDFGTARSEIVALQDEIRLEEKFHAPPLRLSRLQAAIDRLEQVEQPRVTARDEPPASYDFFTGNALFHLNRVDEAVAAWQSCIRKNPAFSPAYQNLTVAYWLTGRIDDALASIATARRLGLPIAPSLAADIENARAGTNATLRAN